MPIIRVELQEGIKTNIKKKIREKIKKTVLETLAPKQTKYDYVAISEVYAEIGDGIPLVTIDLRPGREPDRKKALVDGIALILKEELNIDSKDIYVIFRETSAENHYTGGDPLPKWVPASELNH